MMCVIMVIAMMPAMAFAEEGEVTADDQQIVNPVVEDGNQQDPEEPIEDLEINDLAELKAFRDAVNGGNDYKGKIVTLAADIDLANEEWTPIGQVTFDRAGDGSYVVNSVFKGTFDGQNHTISNLKITDSEANGVGLFGAATNATIKNININNVNIVADGTAAAIAGYMIDYSYPSVIDNCHVSGNISIVADWAYVGGIAAYGHANISNCSVVADGTGVLTSENRNAVAGIMGWNYGFSVTGCQVKNLDLTGWANIAGVEGYVPGGHTISECDVDNVNITKTRVDGIATVGLASGGWSYSASKAITIANNSFNNITLNGNYVYSSSANILYGGEYSANASSNFVTENNTQESITNNLIEVVKDAAAFKEKVEAGGTVTLINDITLSETINITKDVVIEGNGNTITSSASKAFVIKDGATVTVKDCTINASTDGFYLGVKDVDGDSAETAILNINSGATVNAGECCVVVYAGTLNTAGTLTGNTKLDDEDSYAAVQGSGNLGKNATTVINVTGGSITNNTDLAIYQPQAGQLNISGGTITGTTAVYVKAGSLNVTGGTLVATGTKADYNTNNDGGDSTGDTVVIEAYKDSYNPMGTIELNGGTFNSANAEAVATYEQSSEDNAPEKFVKGGVFNTNPLAYVADSTKVYLQNNTYYVGTAPDFSGNNNTWVKGNDGIYTEAYVEPYYPPVDPTPVTPAPSTPKDDVVTNETTNTGAAGETVVTPTTNANVSASTTTTTTETGAAKTETTVEQTTADKIVESAVANKSEEVVIDATTAPAPTTGTTGTTTPAAETTEAAVVIPTQTIETIATETDAAVTIKTDVAEIKLDNTAAAAIAEQAADDGTISIVAVKTDEVVVEEETVTGETEKVTEVHFELKVVCSERGVIGDFQGGTVTVTVPVPEDMHTEELVAVYIDAQGHYHRVTGVKNANGTFTFTTDHFSSYAVMTAEEAEKAIAEQKAKVESVKLKLRSANTKTSKGKKAIKLTVSEVTDTGIDFDGYVIYRSTKKTSGFKKIYTTKTGTYYNTSAKKGVKYYYKAKGFVTIDGEKVYTDWSLKAIRTAK